MFAFRLGLHRFNPNFIIPSLFLLDALFFSLLCACFHVASLTRSVFFFFYFFVSPCFFFLFFYSICSLSDMKISLGGTFLPLNSAVVCPPIIQTNKGQQSTFSIKAHYIKNNLCLLITHAQSQFWSVLKHERYKCHISF